MYNSNTCPEHNSELNGKKSLLVYLEIRLDIEYLNLNIFQKNCDSFILDCH